MINAHRIMFYCILGLCIARCTRDTCKNPPAEPVNNQTDASKNNTQDKSDKPAQPGSATEQPAAVKTEAKSKAPDGKTTNESEKADDTNKKVEPKDKNKNATTPSKKKPENAKPAAPDTQSKSKNDASSGPATSK